jgi:hypothetical protein
MFYSISRAFWPLVAPTNTLILITAAATVSVLLLRSKLAAWLAATGACALVVGGFTPLSYWLMLPLEYRFPQWEADLHPVV